MSLTRDTVEEIRQYIRENCSTLFGKKFWECRSISLIQFSTKSDKYEQKFFVISKFRVFILHGKTPLHLKIDKKFNLLSLRAIQVIAASKELNLSWEDRSGRSIVKASIKCTEMEPIELAKSLLSALKHYFPDIGPSLSNFIAIVPSQLLSDFQTFPISTPKLLCNNFRRSYVAICDYYDQRYKDEVVWDIEHIYFTHDLHEIRLEDFVHLPVKDQITILACAQFSEYFTGITIEGTKLVSEHIEILFNIIRRSHSLKTLRLINCSLPKDFITHISAAISANIHIPLEYLDFSSNNLDDRKGFQQLATVLPKLTHLKSIYFTNCGLSEKCVTAISSGLISGFTMENSGKKLELRALGLAGNSLKDDVSELVNFISLCTSLRILDLSGTSILIDRLWNNLKLGGLQLEVLKLSGCSTGKKSKEHAAVVKELFGSMVNLKEVDFSNTQIGPDLLQAFLTGLANNNLIKDVNVNLNGVCDKTCAPILEKFLGDCPIATLFLRDSSFENEILPVLSALRKMKSLTMLDIGGNNFYTLKSNKKYASIYSHVLDELVKMMNESNLQELNLSDARIGETMHIILNAMGISKLSLLDISNNEMGNTGARLLSKALQLNHCLQKLYIDRNQITAEGFAELSNALKLNRTLQSMPTPMIDVAEAFGKPDRSRVLTAVSEIERYLERNRSEKCRNEELRQKVIHQLNNRSEKYEINSSDYKRIIFFEVIKVISDFGAESPIRVSTDDIIDTVVTKLHQISKINDDKTLAKLKEILAEHGVEICEQIEAQNPGQEDYLKKNIKQLVENHLTEISWATVFMKADRLLTLNNALKLRGSFSNGAIDHSVHVGYSKLNHRPASMIHDSSDTPSRATSIDELNNGSATPLVHLAKSRPRPAHRLRNIKDENGNTSSGLDSTPPSSSHTPITTTMNNSTTSHMSQSSSSGDSNGSPLIAKRAALLPPPASPQLYASVPDELISSTTTTPPPIPRRTPNMPPKLPPKPETSPAKSPLNKHKSSLTSASTSESSELIDRF
uniref:CARMIL pleckstrin homology domain-containing protein n=1 Tax=Panagrolaimus superbus TaxID=310955 RepID=A0A914Y306_9BILA